jgi:arylsulfatase A
VPYNAPHAPYQVPDEYYDRYAGLTAGNQRDRDVLASIYAMVENVDDNISRILDKLEQLNLLENTIVVFMSDNGPTTVQRFNGNMRGQKSTVYEGGIRVPCYISWKGKIKHQVIEEPTSIIDIMPTLLSLCGIKEYQTAFPIDGIDLTEFIEGKTEQLPDRMIFTHVWGGRLAPYVGSVRTRNYRLSVFQNRAELYNIKDDPGEKDNLYEQDPQRAKTLHDAYLKWFEDASKNVKLNPLVPVGYDCAKTVRIQAPEGKMHGKLDFYSRIPNRSWVHQFQTPDDYLTFQLDAVQSGDYEISVEYSQPDGGNPILVADFGQNTVRAGLPQYTADSIPSPDRVLRWQAHEKNWGKHSLGVVSLHKGQHELKLYAENATSKDIQINTILITRKE